MDSHTMMEAQTRVRYQSNTLRDQMKDLYEWEQEIKILERENKEEKKTFAAVRGSEDASTSNGDDIVKSPAHQKADELKNKGNECVKKGEFKKAITFYTEAIRTYKFDSVFFTNRALCYLKLKQYVDCIEDCSIAIQMDASSVKAFYRRMQANEHLSNVEDALSDCRAVLNLDPENKDAKRSLATLTEKQQKLAKVKAMPKKEQNNQRNYTIREARATAACPPKVAKIGTSPPQWSKSQPDDVRIDFYDCEPHLRSKQSLHDIPIKDVFEFEGALSTTPKVTAVAASTENVIVENNNNKVDNINKNDEVAACSKSASVDKKAEQSKADNKIAVSTQELVKETPEKTAFTASSSKSPRRIETPKTTTEFHMTWASASSEDERYELLKKCAGEDFNKLLGSQFTSEILSEVLSVLQRRFVPDELAVGRIIMGIVTNSEMKIFAFMLSDAEKLIFTQLFTYMRAIGEDRVLANAAEEKFNSLLA